MEAWGSPITINRAVEPLAHKPGKIADVVGVAVRKKYIIDCGGRKREVHPVKFAEVFKAPE